MHRFDVGGMGYNMKEYNACSNLITVVWGIT